MRNVIEKFETKHTLHYHLNTVLFLLCYLLVSSLPLTAQSELENENVVNHQFWLDIYPHFYINEEVEYYGDAGYRTVLNKDIWSRIYVRPAIRYHISKLWEFHSGLGLIYVFNEFSINRFEVTPWQAIKLNWPRFKRLKFNSMLKLEERISFLTNNWETSFDLRLRYKVSGRLSVVDFNEESFLYLPFYAEIFIPFSDDIQEFFSNRGRAGLGLSYNISKKWGIEFLFNWQISRGGRDESFGVTDYVYQIKIKRLWNFKKIIKF